MVTGKVAIEEAGQGATATERPSRRELMGEAAALHARFGKPLEPEHCGKFLAVTPDGRTVLGEDLEAVSREAAAIGRGSFLFKIGEVAVGHIR